MRVPLLVGILCSGLSAQVSLAELARIAAERSARQRPAQEKALEPFWPDLRLEYAANREYLDQQVLKIANLGDAVVPLLLEKLTPPDDSSPDRNLAENSARVLRLMEPGSFVDDLIEILDNESHAARYHAVTLLGASRSPAGAHALVQRLPGWQGRARRAAVRSLTLLHHGAAAPVLVPMLGSGDRRLRIAVLDYLARVHPQAVLEQVLDALSVERDSGLLPRYVDYLRQAAEGHLRSAELLLPLLTGDQLDPADTKRLVRALGVVAPKGHQATLAVLHALLKGQTGTLGRTAALSLFALGDKTGVQELLETIASRLRRSHNDPLVLFQRGELYFELENWKLAAADFEKVERHSRREKMKRRAQLLQARCEAQQGRWSQTLRALRGAQPSHQQLLDLAEQDPALAKALRRPTILKWINSLPRAGNGQKGQND